MATVQLTGFRGATGGPTVQLTGFRGVATNPQTVQLTGFRGVAVNDPTTVNAGGDAPVDAFVDATLTPVWSGLVTTWVWTQTAGPAVTLVGTGSTRQYLTPATLTGVALTFRITVTTAGGATATDTVTHTIRPHAGPWKYVGATLTPVAINRPTPL